jgi:hypothetical protein
VQGTSLAGSIAADDIGRRARTVVKVTLGELPCTARRAAERAVSDLSVEPMSIPGSGAKGPADAGAWEDLVGRSCNGTFLHTPLRGRGRACRVLAHRLGSR